MNSINKLFMASLKKQTNLVKNKIKATSSIIKLFEIKHVQMAKSKEAFQEKVQKINPKSPLSRQGPQQA